MDAALYNNLVERKIGMKQEHEAPYVNTPVGINATLSERAKTHGCFVENGRIMQALKMEMINSVNWNSLAPHQQEALQMIQHKIGRILSGDPNEPDHWKDIAGYATLVENIITTGKSHI